MAAHALRSLAIVGEVHGDAASPAYLQCLFPRGQHSLLAQTGPRVGVIEATHCRGHLGQLDELVGIGVGPRGVVQARRKPAGALYAGVAIVATVIVATAVASLLGADSAPGGNADPTSELQDPNEPAEAPDPTLAAIQWIPAPPSCSYDALPEGVSLPELLEDWDWGTLYIDTDPYNPEEYFTYDSPRGTYVQIDKDARVYRVASEHPEDSPFIELLVACGPSGPMLGIEQPAWPFGRCC